MSRNVRDQKLDSISRCLTRIAEHVPKNVDDLRKNLDVQDILILNLERLIQTSVDAGIALIVEKGWGPVPDSMAGVFNLLELNEVISSELSTNMKKSVGFRNICVHEYDKIDWDIVFAIASIHIKQFKKFAQILDQ